jgi:enterobactin synthetase component D
MLTESQQFLFTTNNSNKIKIDGVVEYQCNYDPAYYSDSLFSKLKIHFPNYIANAVQKRKAEFLAGRFCAKKVLNKLKVTNYAVLADKNRCPLWPEHIKGSITHNNNFAMAAITTKPSVLGIGIDIESIISATVINNIVEEVLFDDEYSLLKRDLGTPEMLFSLIFSIKETFFKAAYPSTGYFFGFDAIKIVSLDFESNRFELILCQNLSSFLKQGLLFKGYFKVFGDQVLTMMLIE